MSFFPASIFETFLPLALLLGVALTVASWRKTVLTLGGAFIAGVALARWVDSTTAAALWWSSLALMIFCAGFLLSRGQLFFAAPVVNTGLLGALAVIAGAVTVSVRSAHWPGGW